MYKIKDLKILKDVAKKEYSKYINAKRMLEVWKEQPDFLYNLISVNTHCNEKGIEKKFGDIVKKYKSCIWYQCPECNGFKGRSVNTGWGAFGEPTSDFIGCNYCSAEGRVTEKHVNEMNEKELKEDERELKQIKKRLKKRKKANV